MELPRQSFPLGWPACCFHSFPMMTARIILITQCINCNPNGPRFIFRETDKPKGYQLTEMLFPLIIKRAINRSFYISVRFDREVFNHREF